MKAIRHIVGICLLALSSPNLANANCPDEVVIHAIGDSITQGLMRNGSGALSGIVNAQFGGDPFGSYSPSIKSKISTVLNESGSSCNSTTVGFKNWGVGGYRSNQVIGLIPSVMSGVNPQQSNKLHYFLVMAGANDLYEGINPSDTRNNLGLVLDRLRNFGVTNDQIVLANITQNFLFPQIDNAYNPLIADLAAEDNVAFIDMYSCMQPWDNLDSGDGLHVSTAGYTTMAGCFLTAFEDDLRSKIRNSGGNIAAIFLLLLDEDEAPMEEETETE